MLRAISVAVLAGMALPGQIASVSAEWDTRKMLTELVAKVEALSPILEKTSPKEWVAKGAPDAYIAQWNAAKSETEYLVRTVNMLAKQPERLPLALEAYFRMQAADDMLISLGEGIRRYQSAPLADQLRATLTENANNRERLRQYLLELAEAREKEFQIADREAQRCRASLARQKGSAERRKEQK